MERLNRYVKDGNLKVRVKPNSDKTEIDRYDKARDELVVRVTSPPEKGKANKELVKFLAEKLGKTVTLRAGAGSSRKLLKVQ